MSFKEFQVSHRGAPQQLGGRIQKIRGSRQAWPARDSVSKSQIVCFVREGGRMVRLHYILV